MKLNFRKTEEMPRRMRDRFAPSKEFTRATRARFLAAFEAYRPSAHSAPAPRFAIVLKAAIGSLAGVAVLVGGLSAYADTQNVPVGNALYSFKRIGESIQLALAAPAVKAQLQSTFTVRRIDEINDLSRRVPTSTALTGLTDDFNASINSSISVAESNELSDGDLDVFCGKLLSAIATSSVPIYENLLKHSETLNRFEHACEKAKGVGMSVGVAAGGARGAGGANGGDHGEGKRRDERIKNGEPAVVPAQPVLPTPASTSTITITETTETTTTVNETSARSGGELHAGDLRDYLRTKLRSLVGNGEGINTEDGEHGDRSNGD